MRRAGTLGALLATAALLCAMPGLMRLSSGAGRVDQSLRPPELRTLTVWLMPGDVGDRKLISHLCSAFEKEQKGVRVFLRVVTGEEWEGETTVLPDAALFTTGEIRIPEKVFLPLTDVEAPSGQFAGMTCAVPLWLAPNVLSLPQSWLQRERMAVQKPDSLLAASTAVPQAAISELLTADELPWGMLLQRNAVEKPQGVGWQQLLACCPQTLRAQLVPAVLGTAPDLPVPSASTEEWVITLPYSRTASPTPAPDIATPARVETLAQHQARIQKGESLSAFVFPVAVSDRVRYAALCRDNEDAQAFLRFLLDHQGDALAHGLVPLRCEGAAPDGLLQSLVEAFGTGVLVNAFEHTREEIAQLCADGFARGEDPVRTLLGLR
ncbi:MAG: hypothetical protein IKU70_10800 [Clostridia bacterium]|nr:hypothetical protein [Clostridia bacterium]